MQLLFFFSFYFLFKRLCYHNNKLQVYIVNNISVCSLVFIDLHYLKVGFQVSGADYGVKHTHTMSQFSQDNSADASYKQKLLLLYYVQCDSILAKHLFNQYVINEENQNKEAVHRYTSFICLTIMNKKWNSQKKKKNKI